MTDEAGGSHPGPREPCGILAGSVPRSPVVPEGGAIHPSPIELNAGQDVRGALARCQEGGVLAAAVRGGDGTILGALTDADLRLALVEAADRTGRDGPTVGEALPQGSFVADTATTGADVEAKMRANGVSAVALLDGGAVREVRTLSDPAFRPAGPVVGVVMAGGRGQRLRPLTDKVPKPLLRLGASTIIERIIGRLAAAGIRDVFLAVNYKAEAFEARLGTGGGLGVELHYLRERSRLGTAGPLTLLPERPEGRVLVTNGDIMTRLDFVRLLDYHVQRGGAATMAAVEHVTRIPYAVVRTAGSRLLGVSEKPETRALCNAGIYVLEPEVLGLLRPNELLDMPDLFARAVGSGMAVHVFPVVEKWFDIGSPEDFERVLLEFATGEEE
jgi:dTDP-glucose pyrophosphorylase